MRKLFPLILFILLLSHVKTSFAQVEIERCYNYLSAGDYRRAVEFGKIAVAKYPRNLAAHLCLGGSYLELGELKLALGSLKNAEKLATSKDELIAIYNMLGQTYDDMGDLDNALVYYSRLLSLAREIGLKVGEATALNNIAGIYDKKGELDKSLDYYQQALGLITDDKNKATVYNNIAVIYSKKGDHQKAIEYLNKSIEIGMRAGNYHGVAASMLNLGNEYREVKDFKKAEETLKEGLKRIQKVGDKFWEATAYKYLGVLYRDMDNIPLAKEYLTRAYNLYKSIGATNRAENVMSILSELSKSK